MNTNEFNQEVKKALEAISNDIFDYEAAYAETQSKTVSYPSYNAYIIPDDEIEAFAAPVSIFANNAAFIEEIVRQLNGTPYL